MSNALVKKLLKTFFIFSILVPVADTFAHTNNNTIDTALTASAALTWRSDEVVKSNEPYLIPGTFLGGEALAQPQGATLDEVRLDAIYKASSRYYAKASISSHHDNEVSLETFSLVAHNLPLLGSSSIELGKFESKVTPTAYWHSDTSTFSESSLLSDIFFGRHYVDTGARALKTLGNFTFGVEAFNGDSWPANSGEGTATVFIQSQFHLKNTSLNINTWAMDSSALDRLDDRYSNGHSHGGIQISSSVEEYQFTGDILQYGALLGTETNIRSFSFLSEIEWMATESEGRLENATQQSLYENHHEGYRIYLSAGFKHHSISLQHEEIALQNEFLSPITPNFAQDANLINNDFEPSKSTIAWSYAITNEFTIRLEYASLKLFSSESDTRTNFGIVWRKPLLN